jgi:hypothetical protein
MRRKRMWLIAEYCGHNFYMGWHLYLRDNPGYQKRNADGNWGWVRPGDRGTWDVVKFFEALGIELKGDWSRPEDGCAEFVKRFPMPGRKVWGKRRGGIRVSVGYWGDLRRIQPKTKRVARDKLNLNERSKV